MHLPTATGQEPALDEVNTLAEQPSPKLVSPKVSDPDIIRY